MLDRPRYDGVGRPRDRAGGVQLRQGELAPAGAAAEEALGPFERAELDRDAGADAEEGREGALG